MATIWPLIFSIEDNGCRQRCLPTILAFGRGTFSNLGDSQPALRAASIASDSEAPLATM
jgi:hypothetical protein